MHVAFNFSASKIMKGSRGQGFFYIANPEPEFPSSPV